MKKNVQSDLTNDLKYFQKAMQGVRPLVIKDKEIKLIFKKNINKTSISNSKKIIFSESISHTNLQNINLKNISSDEKLFFARPGGGLQHSLLQKLKQGKIKITQSLDLHGMIIDEARRAIENFIKQCIIQHHRYIMIIHGKGRSSEDMPILKNHLYHWLIQIPSVLAFCSAIPKDGGTGAVYVVLNKLLLQDIQCGQSGRRNGRGKSRRVNKGFGLIDQEVD